MAFRVSFSTRRAGQQILWRYSSRLIAGKVVALSSASDKFATQCVIAVVAARPMEGVIKSPPEVDLFFAQTEDIDPDPLKEWLMIEARSGYYEAHRHTMTALQKLSRERFVGQTPYSYDNSNSSLLQIPPEQPHLRSTNPTGSSTICQVQPSHEFPILRVQRCKRAIGIRHDEGLTAWSL